MNKRVCATYAIFLLVAGCCVLPSSAAPFWKIRKSGENALYLITSQGWSAMTVQGLATTSEGYLAVVDIANTGNEVHVLDPVKTTTNGLAEANAAIGYILGYDPGSSVYKGSVGGGVTLHRWIKGPTASWPAANMFFSVNSPPNGPGNWQPRDNSDNYSATAGKMAALTDYVNIDGDWAGGVAVVASGGSDTYNLLYGEGSGSMGNLNLGVLKFSASALTPGSNNYGTRTYTTGGHLTGGSGGTKGSLLADLVPSVSDNVTGMAWNEAEGRLYFVSHVSSHVYLSAVSFTWGTTAAGSVATYVDLDPDTSNNYLDITHAPGGSLKSLTSAVAISFSPDGKVLYVGDTARVWIFDAVAATPRGTLILMQ